MNEASEFYGLHSWHSWCQKRPAFLKPYKRSPSTNWTENDCLDVFSYRELFHVVAFLNVMNKNHQLAFRGQATDLEPTPTLLRDTWARDTDRSGFDVFNHREHYWNGLANASSLVTTVLLEQKLPRHMPFEAYGRRQELRIAPWSVVQHYQLWPTPLLDLTTSLRVAASFSLGLPKRRQDGYLYVFALQQTASDVMALSGSSRFAAVRLSAVCPPDTPRPHLQEGLLVGNPNLRAEDLAHSAHSPLVELLVAKFHLIDRPTPGERFFDRDFPRHTTGSLLPGGTIRDDLVRAMNYRIQDGRLTVG